MLLLTLVLSLLSSSAVFAIDNEQLARQCSTISGYGPTKPGRLPTTTITRTLKRTTITLPRTTTVFEGSYLASSTATVSSRESATYYVGDHSTWFWHISKDRWSLEERVDRPSVVELALSDAALGA